MRITRTLLVDDNAGFRRSMKEFLALEPDIEVVGEATDGGDETMKDQKKTKEQLIEELAQCRQRVTELEAAETELKWAEEALRESREKYREIINGMNDTVWVIGFDGKFIDVNETAVKVLGYSREELLSMGPPDIDSHLTEDQIEDLIRRMPSDEIQVFETEHATKEGTTIPVEISSSLVSYQGRHAILSIARDITERKQAEEALRDSRRMLQTVLDSIPSTVFWKDCDSIYLGANRALLEAAGLKSSEEIVGKSDYDLPWGKNQADSFREDDRRVMESGIPEYDIIEPYLRADGTHAWAKTNKVPLRDTEGNIVGVLGTSEDITERKRAEEALRESEERYRSLFDRVLVGLYRTTPAGQILDANPALVQMLGYPDQESLLAVSAADVYANGGDRAREQALLEREEVVRHFETQMRRRDGAVIWVRDSVRAVRNADDRVLCYEGSLEDITERKRAEEEIRRHLERIEALLEVDRAIISTLELTEVLDIILEELERVIPYHSAGIFLFSNGIARLTAGRGFPDLERVLQVSFPVKEDPLTHELMQKKQPLILADAQADERFLARGDTEYVRSWIGVPLIAKGRALGFLTVDHREAGVYDEESAEMVQAFASQAAIAIENARLFEQTKRRVAELTTLQQLGMKLASSLASPLVLNSIADSTLELTKADYVHIFTLDPQTGEFMQRVASWPPEAKEPPIAWLRKEGLTAAVVEAKEPVIIERASDHPLYSAPEAREWGVESVAGFPLKGKRGLTGVLNLVFLQSHTFNKDELRLLALLADQAAIAIENARLYQEAQRELAERKRAEQEVRQSYAELRTAFSGTVNTLVSAIEMRDPYTAGHQRRVTQLACAIANEMGLPEEQTEGLRMAALIHDLGKINVPADILSKPGQLTKIEFGLIKMHPQVGHDVLKAVEFPWPVAQMVLQHHERMDGSGYPQGLLGDEILLEARILAVADVVEAMASHRPYRAAHSIEDALEEISQNRGILYDPEVVDACLKLFTEEGFEFE